MNSRLISSPSSDGDPLQVLLASADTVLGSGIDTRLLSAIIEVQQSAAREFDIDRAVQMIADHALSIANTSGFAVAILQEGQLVCRVGSGSAAAFVGRRMLAVLSSPGTNESRREILRVENAQTDSRIQADICREFGAKSLLILPICDRQALIGVIEFLFNQPHRFQDHEIRADRLLADLVEDTLLRDVEPRQNSTVAKRPTRVPEAIVQIVNQAQEFSRQDKSEPVPAPKCPAPRGVPLPARSELLEFRAKAATIARSLIRPPFGNSWRIATALIVVIGFAMLDRFAQNHYRPSSPTGSKLASSRVAVPSAPQSLAIQPLSRLTEKSAKADKKASHSTFKRIRNGGNEIDYVAEDVTIRIFTPIPIQKLPRGGPKVVNIGDDVTVRYFKDKADSK